jgi:hypothetical protein
MAVSLYTFVDLYRRNLVTAGHLLDKGAAHAAGLGITEAEMLGWRLAEDMHPLGFQLGVVINFSQLWTSRIAGVPTPAAVPPTLDVAGFKTAMADAEAWLGQLTAEQFAGRDDVPLSFEIMPGMAPTMPASQWLTVFATTNISFHLTTAYAILRHHGVPLGKADMFASGL